MTILKVWKNKRNQHPMDCTGNLNAHFFQDTQKALAQFLETNVGLNDNILHCGRSLMNSKRK